MKTTLRKLTAAWPLVIFLLPPSFTHAETAVQAWVQRYAGSWNRDDSGIAVAVDGSNNVVVTGFSFGIGGYTNYATIKYSSAGLPLWTNRYIGPGNKDDRGHALAVDREDNVIVTGYSYGVASSYDYATIKYSSAGLPLWTNRYNGPGNNLDQALGVAVDGNNDVIVTGRSYSSTSEGSRDYATVKYSSAGLPLWTNRYNGPGNNEDGAKAVAVDGSNNVIVMGYSCSTTAPSSTDYATIKYSSDGVPLWTNRYNGPGNGSDYASAMAVDGSNNVIVTGYAWNGSYSDYTTIKYSGDGVPLWTNRYIGPGNRTDWAHAVAVDGNNDVIVTGFSYANPIVGPNYATIKYSSGGTPLWTNRYVGPGMIGDYAIDMAVDSSNSVIVTGYSASTENNYDYVTIKYSSAGAPLWTNRYNGPGNGNDFALAVVADKNNNVIVTGNSSGIGSGTDFTTVKYIGVPEPVLNGLRLTNDTFQLRVDAVLRPGTLVIEACTNLPAWAPLFTNTTPTNVLFYTDPDAGSNPTRFYRAFQFP